MVIGMHIHWPHTQSRKFSQGITVRFRDYAGLIWCSVLQSKWAAYTLIMLSLLHLAFLSLNTRRALDKEGFWMKRHACLKNQIAKILELQNLAHHQQAWTRLCGSWTLHKCDIWLPKFDKALNFRYFTSQVTRQRLSRIQRGGRLRETSF
jgi:hypothetical protein